MYIDTKLKTGNRNRVKASKGTGILSTVQPISIVYNV